MWQTVQQWWLRREGESQASRMSSGSGYGSGKSSSGQRRLSWVAIVVAVVVVWLGQQFQVSNFIDDLELKTYDLRVFWQRGKMARKPSAEVVLIPFDDTTLSLFEDEYGTWPWNRQVSADMMTWLSNTGAKAVVFDVMYTHPRRGSDKAGDAALIKAFQTHANVYVGMNADNHGPELEALGKGTSSKHFEHYGEQLGLKIEESPAWDGFWKENALLSLNNVRFLLPGLMSVGDRVGLLNHYRDRDGVSRSNPLLVRVNWHTAQGQKKSTVYPYLGFKVWLDLMFPKDKYPSGPPPLVLTRGGQIQVGPYRVPLQNDGRFLIGWYNRNVDQELAARELKHIQYQLARLSKDASHNKERLFLENQQSQLYGVALEKFTPKSYMEVPAWKVLQAIHLGKPATLEASAAPQKQGAHLGAETLLLAKRSNRLTPLDAIRLKAFFKDKIVFVGATAVATYDIKTTPISPTLPGMVLQATLFDNLWQAAHPNNGQKQSISPFVQRASGSTNLLLTLILSVVCVLCIAYTPSVWLGIAGTLVIGVFYVALAFGLFVGANQWVNIAAPLCTAGTVVLMTYVLRYLSRTADLEVTYQLATTDAMTGLKNHRYFQEHLARMLDQSKRSGQPVALLMVDIDYFKKFNDTYGHQAGDRVLKAVSQKLEHTVRKSDLVARYGGEEMAVVLADTDAEAAFQTAQKIVAAVAAEPYGIAEGTFKHVTISVGVSVCPDHALEPADLIAVADVGLYAAKEGGRNRVGLSPDHWPDWQTV
ncbi:MAG: diguanylate cyclase [Vampirovibrionales bacterium]|nr:diguanylate cyclase [Vampirovibrionales bacterium]